MEITALEHIIVITLTRHVKLTIEGSHIRWSRVVEVRVGEVLPFNVYDPLVQGTLVTTACSVSVVRLRSELPCPEVCLQAKLVAIGFIEGDRFLPSTGESAAGCTLGTWYSMWFPDCSS